MNQTTLESIETAAAPERVVWTKRDLSERGLGSERHIERLDAAGKLPRAIHLGRKKVWLADEIIRFLEAGAPDRKTFEAMKKGRRVR